MNWIKASLLLSLTLLLTLVLSTRFGSLPALGELLNPFQGFWQNMAQTGLKKDYNIQSDKLNDPVHIIFDERNVPRVFANNDYDLYFAQGYVHAKDRLWQLDFQTRAAAGRLSEIFGSQTLQYDRYQRRIGMTYGAERIVAEINRDPRTRHMVQAYIDGINHFITHLRKAHYPIEYKITGISPEMFNTQKVALMFMNLAQTLNFHPLALRYQTAKELLDEDIFKQLYPDYQSIMEPVMSREDWDFEPLTVDKPDSAFTPSIIKDLNLQPSEEGAGSNSWAVSGSNTRSGAPILVNDPHLSLTLPSIWYEMQLVGNDVNVYGVSIPGAPGIVLGFNEYLGWGSTNAGHFSMDIYEIEFRDDYKMEYYHDQQWKPVNQRMEEIKVRNLDTVIDTVYYTHHGPVVQPDSEQTMYSTIPKGHAIRWISHDASNELLAYYLMNRSTNIEEFKEGLRHFQKPSQVKSYADIHGNIGNFNVGKFAVRFQGQGQTISDGRDPAYDWRTWIPFEQLPHEINPDRGFISSANQPIVDKNYPYYIGFNYAGFSRGRRINQMLEQADNIDMDFMQEMLMDNRNLHAEYATPAMLDLIDRSLLNAYEQEVLEALGGWEYHFSADDNLAYVFRQWWDSFYDTLWEPLSKNTELPVLKPNRFETTYLLQQNKLDLFPADIPELLARTFSDILTEIREQHGDDLSNWKYGEMRSVEFRHLSRLPGFGVTDLNTGGDADAINAFRDNHGPSWRMVVEFTDPVQARVIYPGGQTGNPAHRDYDNNVLEWSRGELYDIQFLYSPEDEIETTKKLLLRP